MKVFIRISFVLIFLLVLAWGIWLQFTPNHTSILNYSYNLGYALLYLVGAVAGLWAASYISTGVAMGSALLYLGLAELSYTLGLVIWSYYNLVLHVSVPYPSLADLFFAFVYILLAVGGAYFLKMVASHIHIQHLLEVMGIFFVSAVIILGFLNSPDTSATTPVLTKLFNIWYPLGDSLLIAVSYLVFRAGKGKFQSGMLIIILGLLVQVFADLIFANRSGANMYWNGDISDILFTVSGGILSYGVITLLFDFISSPSSQ